MVPCKDVLESGAAFVQRYPAMSENVTVIRAIGWLFSIVSSPEYGTDTVEHCGHTQGLGTCHWVVAHIPAGPEVEMALLTA